MRRGRRQVKQRCKEIKVGTWQSGEATVTFEEEVFSWITKREVPGLGNITLKIRTSSIHEAVFDKRSNVLKIRGIVEVPMDKLDRYYDFLSRPGTRLPGAAPAQYTTPSTPSLACCCAGSPKGYLCLTFNNINNLTEVLEAVPRLKARTTFQNGTLPVVKQRCKEVPRLKARTTFQNGMLPGWSDTAGAGASSAPGAAAAARACQETAHDLDEDDSQQPPSSSQESSSQVEITGVRSREEKDAEGRANAIDVDGPSGEAGGSEAEARPAQRPRVERSVRERLVELKSLHEEGLISEANFEARQRVILDDM